MPPASAISFVAGKHPLISRGPKKAFGPVNGSTAAMFSTEWSCAAGVDDPPMVHALMPRATRPTTPARRAFLGHRWTGALSFTLVDLLYSAAGKDPFMGVSHRSERLH